MQGLFFNFVILGRVCDQLLFSCIDYSMPIRFFPKTVDWESRYSRHALVEKHRQNFRYSRVRTILATFGLFINVSHPIARYRQHHGVGMLLWEATG
jgi:hypothetical protein